MRNARIKIESPRRGAAVVEAALVLPIFFMVVLGIIEFGRGMMVGQLVNNAARQGARDAIIDGSTNATITQNVQTLLKDTVGVKASDVTVCVTVEAGTGNPNPANDLSKAMPKDLCRVQISVPYSKVGYIAGRFLQNTNIRSACAMRHE
jgi:Flp pilus assembly protein TadG